MNFLCYSCCKRFCVANGRKHLLTNERRLLFDQNFTVTLQLLGAYICAFNISLRMKKSKMIIPGPDDPTCTDNIAFLPRNAGFGVRCTDLSLSIQRFAWTLPYVIHFLLFVKLGSLTLSCSLSRRTKTLN